MKKNFLTLASMLFIFYSCNEEDINENNNEKSLKENKRPFVGQNFDYPDEVFGTISALTYKNPNLEELTETITTNKVYFGKINRTLPNGVSLIEGKTTTTYFWFKGTSSGKLFKPIVYGRVFAFGDSDADSIFVTRDIKKYLSDGNNDLHFDDGIFEGLHPYTFLTSHNETTEFGRPKKSSYSREGEIKVSIPHNSWVVVQFIIEKSPNSLINLKATNARYSYAIYKHTKGKPYKHIKVIFDDSAIGYEGYLAYYQEGI